MLSIENLSLKYNAHEVFTNVNLTLEHNSKVVLTGCSGSGKSSLMHIMAGLLSGYQGKVIWDKYDINNLSMKQKLSWRRQNIGFIFQFHYLLKDLSVIENVMLPLILNGFDNSNARKNASQLLHALEINNQESHIATLSGGERQRVAMARAIIHKPKIIIADEPTGALDPKLARNAINILFDFACESSIILATHNLAIISAFDKHYELESGALIER